MQARVRWLPRVPLPIEAGCGQNYQNAERLVSPGKSSRMPSFGYNICAEAHYSLSVLDDHG